jgi:hypothetical protein
MNSIDSSEEKAKRYIRRLIWLYFWLLLIEGALRKWVLPDYSNPLLLVRDPVLIAIYLLAIPARVLPRNGWTMSLMVIGFLSLLATFVQLWPYVSPKMIALVGGYGFRSNFFHLPLIFVMASVLRPEDVKRFGWWTLLLLVPMSVLMAAQFGAAPDAFLNRTPGGEGEMMMAALGKVRTAGTFSFVVGVAAYLSLAAGYLVWGLLNPGLYKSWLLTVAGIALVVGVAVSGSRLTVGACAVVVASLVLVIVLRRDVVNRFGRALIVILILGIVVNRLSVFHEGVNVLSTRFAEVAEASEQSVARGLIARVLASFEDAFFVYGKAPFLGYGLGIGTNAGAKFLTGHSGFLLTEGEWSRIFLESGPVLGLAYVAWRFALVGRIGSLCIKSVRWGNPLPLLLFSSSFLPMLNGQFGQPTILGFTVFTTGLALAARNEDTSPDASAAETPSMRVKSVERIVRRRSAYAERLHGPSAEHGQSNGFVDR